MVLIVHSKLAVGVGAIGALAPHVFHFSFNKLHQQIHDAVLQLRLRYLIILRQPTRSLTEPTEPHVDNDRVHECWVSSSPSATARAMIHCSPR